LENGSPPFREKAHTWRDAAASEAMQDATSQMMMTTAMTVAPPWLLVAL
jgi:hypothetical protein